MRVCLPLFVLVVACTDSADEPGVTTSGNDAGLGGHTDTSSNGGGAGASGGGGASAADCVDGDTRTVACGQCGTRTEPCVSHAWDSSGPCLGDGGCAPGETYFTSFDADEQPISENGVWAHASNPWQKVRTSGGNALAAAYTEIYDDAYAYLGNWAGGDDYEIEATVYQGAGSVGEAEILLRVSDTGSTVQTYEFLYNTGGSWQFVRWNGGLGDFTVLPSGGSTPSGGNGTQIRATIVGSSIALYWRASAADAWTTLDTFDDASIPSGKPGMSFYVHQADDNIDSVGFSDWRVTAL